MEVFGLRARPAYAGFLLSVASQSPRWRPVHGTEFVLVYRCGAAPDSHRVPSSLSECSGTNHESLHTGARTFRSTKYLSPSSDAFLRQTHRETVYLNNNTAADRITANAIRPPRQAVLALCISMKKNATSKNFMAESTTTRGAKRGFPLWKNTDPVVNPANAINKAQVRCMDRAMGRLV